MFLLARLREALRGPVTAAVVAVVGENLPLARAESIPSREPRPGAILGTSNVWRCFKPVPAGGCKVPEEVGLAGDW